MKERLRYAPLVAVIILFAANFFIWYAVLKEGGDKKLKVAFLDVGQGDAIFVEASNGNQLLVDGGSGKQVLRALSAVMPSYDRSIDAVLATHPDKDHIGGFPQILDRFKVNEIFVSGADSDTAVYKELENKIKERKISEVVLRKGARVRLSDEIYFDVLFPDADVSHFKESNDASIVGKLVYGDKTFLLTGDSPTKIENHLISIYGKDLKSDVLKLGHHGSRTSSSETYLGFVSPQYAIISAGCKNSYGHPHKEVLALLDKFKIPKLSTCDSGTIVFETDGEKLSYKSFK